MLQAEPQHNLDHVQFIGECYAILEEGHFVNLCNTAVYSIGKFFNRDSAGLLSIQA